MILLIFPYVVFLGPMLHFASGNGTISPQQVTLNATNDSGLVNNFNRDVPLDGPFRDGQFACFDLNFTCVFENASNITFVNFEELKDASNPNFFERTFQFTPATVETGQRYVVHFVRTDIRSTGVLDFATQYRCVSDTMRVTPTATVDVLYAPVYFGIEVSNFSDSGYESREGIIYGGDYFSLDSVFITEGEQKDAAISLILYGANPTEVAYEWSVNNKTIGVNNNNNNNNNGMFGRYSANESELTISDVRREDSGVYSVTASNVAGPATGTSGALLVVRFPPEYDNHSSVLYIKRGDPFHLNCTPQLTSADYAPRFAIGDLSGPPSFTQIRYQWYTNGTRSNASGPILNVTMEAGPEHSGTYRCLASDTVIFKTAQFMVAPAKRDVSSFGGLDFIRLPEVVQESTKFSALTTPVDFSVLVGGVPGSPGGLGVTFISSSSLLVSWAGSQVLSGEEEVPLQYIVTLTALDNGGDQRVGVVDGDVSDGQYKTLFDNVASGMYDISVLAENPFGSSESVFIYGLPVGEPSDPLDIAFIVVSVVLGLVTLLAVGLIVYVCYHKVTGILASRSMEKMKKDMAPMESNTYMRLKLQQNPAYGTVSEHSSNSEEDGDSPHHDNHVNTGTSEHFNIQLEVNPSYEDSPTNSVVLTGASGNHDNQDGNHDNSYTDINCDHNPAYVPARIQNLREQQQQQQQQATSEGEYVRVECEENPAYIPAEEIVNSSQQSQQQQQQQHLVGENGDGFVGVHCEQNPAYVPSQTSVDGSNEASQQLSPSPTQQQQQQQQQDVNTNNTAEEPIYSVVGEDYAADVERGPVQPSPSEVVISVENDREDQSALDETYDIYDQIQT